MKKPWFDTAVACGFNIVAFNADDQLLSWVAGFILALTVSLWIAWYVVDAGQAA